MTSDPRSADDASHLCDNPSPGGGSGLVVIRRLHRLVRHGYRPWLGYDVASGQDRDIHLRFRNTIATIGPEGELRFGTADDGLTIIPAGDDTAFDAAYPPNTPNRRNLVRRLYEIGVGSW